MDSQDKQCQLTSLQQMPEGVISIKPASLMLWLRLFLKRHLSYQTLQWLRHVRQQLVYSVRQKQPSIAADVMQQPISLQVGDWVRVRSEQEIQATLDAGQRYRGCAFMGEMSVYCNTRQRVFKRVERFLDERDYRVKRCSGIVLLEGLICQGTKTFGRCDRSCLYFWREEWLEKIIEQNREH